MYPTYFPEVVRAEQSRRLEGFTRWSRLHSRGDDDAPTDGAGRPSGPTGDVRRRHHRPTRQLLLGRGA